MRRLAVALLLVAACSYDDGTSFDVLAAASLTNAFERVAEDVCCPRLSFAASSSVVQQVLADAPADVVATADEATMQRLVDAGVLDGEPITFARNSVVLVTHAGNPNQLFGLADGREKTLAVCAAQVPCGVSARRWLNVTDADVPITSEEPDVRAVLTKVALGEVDVGIVYRTDAVSSDDVEIIDEAPEITNSYLIALVKDAPDEARAFVDAVVAADLGDLGFREP